MHQLPWLLKYIMPLFSILQLVDAELERKLTLGKGRYITFAMLLWPMSSAVVEVLKQTGRQLS